MERINRTFPALASLPERTTAHSVEIIREEGEDGNLESFGFTVWHDHPPVVGSVVPGSPADRVGLKSNLVILSVNGQPVDQLSQQRVTDLINNTPSRSVWLVVSESAEESAHFRTTLGPLHSHSPRMSAHRYTLRSKSQQRASANAIGPRRAVSTSRGVCSSTRVFLHYLGPVEMPPKWSSRGLSLKCIRECVRRMLSVREQHIEVYLVVSVKGMSLQNMVGRTLVTYSRDELYYCGVHMEDECYFGIVTRHHQQPAVDPQVGQVEDASATRWVHHCHVFKVVQGQSKITMTFGQVSSPMNKEQTTPVRSSQTVVNYIRQLFRTEGPQTKGAGSGDVQVSPKPAAVAVQEWQGQPLPDASRVSSSGSPVSTSDESSPVLERRKHDLVDMRHPLEGGMVPSWPVSHGSPSATTLTSLSSTSELVRSAEHVASIGSEPALQQQQEAEAFGDQGDHIHSPMDRMSLPPKNSHLSSSIDSVMTTTTTQAENYDSAPQVGSWITSFDKLLQDPLGLHCFQKFLSSEFSDENIGFWKEVERYKSLHRPEQHKPAAQRIYSLFVNPDARQPVNLDGTCVEEIQQRLDHPPPDLFNAAQKQIYNLMRLDSYQRFKRSEVVQKCLVAEMDGRPLPVSLPQREEAEERDKVNPLPAVRMEDKADSSKTVKEGLSVGRGLFSKRSNSFRNNPKASRFGMYFTNEGKKKSKTVRDKTRNAAGTRVEPEPEGPAVRSGFQMQDEEDADHLEVLNERVGPCFGLALMEKVSKIIPVPKQGSVYDALKNVIRVHKLTFEAIDIRFADNMQPVDLEAAASVLAARYLVVKQSQNYFQAIFPGKEVSVPADPNKTVQQVMDPILHEMGLDPSAVTLYVYGARQALSRSTFAGLLKGQKVHVRMNSKAGLPTSGTHGSLSSADSRSSLHSSSGNLSQQPRAASRSSGNTSHNNNSSNNNDDDLFSMIFKLQSDTLSEQRSRPPPISALLTSRTTNPVAGNAVTAEEEERHCSEPPMPSKLTSATSDQSLAQHALASPSPPPMFSRVRSGSQPSLNESFQEAVTGRKCVSPPPAFSLSQDSYVQGPLFNVEVINQRYRPPPRRSLIPPPTQPPPSLPHRTRARSTSPPPQTRPPPLPRKSAPTEGLVDPQLGNAHFRGKSPLTISTDVNSRGRAFSTGTYSREPTPTSGYGSHSPDSSTVGFSQSHLDSFVFTADSHLSSRVRRGSKESSSSSDGTYMSFQQQPAAKHPAKRAHRAVHQTHSEPGYPLSQPTQPHRYPPFHPAHQLQQWTVAPPADESALLRKGQEMLEQEFREYAQSSHQNSLMYQRFKKVGPKRAVYRFSPPPVDGSMV